MAWKRALILALALATSATAMAETLGFAVNSDDLSEADRLLSINLETGSFRAIGELPSLLEDVEGIAFSPAGELFAVDSATRTLVRVSLENGAAQAVDGRAGNLGFPQTSSYDFGLTFTCDDQLLLVAEQTRSLYSVDPATGAARVIGTPGGLGDAMTALASYGDEVYALAADSGNFYSVDVAAGTASLVGTIGAFEITDAGMAFDADGTLWAISSDFSFDDSRVFRIDPATAAVTMVAMTRPGIESLAIGAPAGCDLAGTPVAPVPVPVNGPFGLALLIGAMLLLTLRRREALGLR